MARAYCESRHLSFNSRLGAGAFKETFAVARSDGEEVALKVYKSGHDLLRVQRETAALGRCEHPTIARLYGIETFQHEQQTYLVSLEEMLGGGTLASRLLLGCVPREGVIRLGTGLITAVDHIARQDLVHRDIKPENIMFRGDGKGPVLVDFGLVRDLRAESLTQTWVLQGPGTPLFASPEQLRNEKPMIDWRSDQFSVAIVLSYAAFGFHPFHNDAEPLEIAVERVANRGPLAERFLAAIGATDLTVLARMLRAWPIHRFRTPRQLGEAWRAQGS